MILIYYTILHYSILKKRERCLTWNYAERELAIWPSLIPLEENMPWIMHNLLINEASP